MHSKHEVIFRALAKDVVEGKFPQGTKLPSIAVLAKSYRTSKVSVSQAMRLLAKEGIVEIRSRRGVFVTKGIVYQTSPEPSPLAAKSKPEKLLDRLTHLISTGHFRVGEALPLKKTLTYQFGTTHVSLSRALELALGKDLIHRRGSALIAGPLGLSSPDTTQKVGTLPAWSPSLSRQVGTKATPGHFALDLEAELAACGHTLLPNRGPEMYVRKGPALRPHPDAAGYYYPCSESVVELVANNRQRLFEQELRRINALGKPAVVFNTAFLRFRFPNLSYRPFRNVFPVGVDNFRAGEMVGKYLTVRGHAKAVFLSFSENYWCIARYLGAKFGMGEKGENAKRAIHLSAGVDVTAFREKYLNNTNSLLENVDRFTRRAFGGYRVKEDYLGRRIADNAARGVITDLHHRELEPCFKRALNMKDAKVWVCADSTVAMAAARFLESRALSYPTDISLLAIHDDEILSDFGISGCDLQIHRMAYLAAHCIIGDIPIKRDRLGVVDCPARIVDRGSVARVRSGGRFAKRP